MNSRYLEVDRWTFRFDAVDRLACNCVIHEYEYARVGMRVVERARDYAIANMQSEVMKVVEDIQRRALRG